MFVDESVVFGYLGTWIEVVNYLEKLLFQKVDLEILWTDSNTVLLEKYM